MHRCLLASLFAIAASGCRFPDLPPIDIDAAADAQMVDVAIECTPNTTSCTDSTLVVCDGNGSGTATTCGFGCAPSSDRCLDLSPSNDLGTYLDQSATAPALSLSGNATIDTSAGTVTNGDGSPVAVNSTMLPTVPVPLMVISASSLDVGNVTVRGSRGLALLINGDATFNGVFSVSAAKFTPGAGASNSQECNAGNGNANTTGGSGSGGGGFGSQGARGGNGGGSTTGGAGGSPRGDETLVPLRAGCPGGVPNGLPNDTYRREGGGGGVLQISARGRIILSPGAFIAANGGGAKSYTDAPLFTCQTAGPQTCHQGAGGGSGGGILLEASSIQVATSGGIVANGGAGHCSSHGEAPDGSLTESPALGSNCAGWVAVGNGGNGGTGGVMPTAGGDSTGTNGQGGGGGGGVGRIRINLPSGTTFDPVPPIVSPAPSLATVSTR